MRDLETAIPLRLLRLTSALLPVGAFAYSRGLEHAADAGLVADDADVRNWVFGTLEHSFATLDGALFLRMMGALQGGHHDEFRRLDASLAATRESRELRLEDTRTGDALRQLLRDTGVSLANEPGLQCQTYAAAYALAVDDMQIAPEAGLLGLMWSTCEAQIGAAMRLGVIGQTTGQRILAGAPCVIERAARIAAETPEADVGNLSFMVGVSSALHEGQYSRLFRS